MADGRDDRVARGPKAGHQLKHEKNYSGEDWAIQHAYLNQNVKMDESQRGNGASSAALRGEGLILKEPLS
jgi:hypothetical protein